MRMVKVMREKWDYLIVLDACRYDYFKKLYGRYLVGKLEKRISVGTGTIEWRNKSFPGYYDDLIYISANPYINSLVSVRDFLATEHFYKIFDLWADFWDEIKSSVLPEIVTREAIQIVGSYKDKRAIIHYIQPHEPYLGVSPEKQVLHKAGLCGEAWVKVGKFEEHRSLPDRLLKFMEKVFFQLNIRGYGLIWYIREKLGIPPAQAMDAVRREFGNEGLRKAYEDNLKAVLPHVKELVEHLSGRIIITADHGEMLGEDGCYCHWSRATKNQLREIPWLIIEKEPKPDLPIVPKQHEKTKELHEEFKVDTKEKIRERLRDLGY